MRNEILKGSLLEILLLHGSAVVATIVVAHVDSILVAEIQSWANVL